MKKLIFLLLLVSLLSACVPVENKEKVEVVQNVSEVSYYPHEVGARWEYLEEGTAIDSAPIISSVLGPTVVNGDIWIATRQVGHGLDTTWFRQYRDDGVFLLKEERPGLILTYDPPLKEFPPVGGLRKGATWEGNTRVEAYYPNATNPADQKIIANIHYSYTVVDERKVTLETGETKVYVIDFVASDMDNLDNDIKTLKQEIWFAPYLGEVKTENGYFLVKSNLLGVSQK